MKPVYDFTGQVALVTGASSGIGLATAQAFAGAGVAVVLADVNEHALRTANDVLTSAGHQALAVTYDVADEVQVAGMVGRTIAAFGRLDMAFNYSGILGPTGDLADEAAAAFDELSTWSLDVHKARTAPDAHGRQWRAQWRRQDDRDAAAERMRRLREERRTANQKLS
jgi:NAD(P)-dependent dehydrogenase (short-subunit alcohol dehydrogenase family)